MANVLIHCFRFLFDMAKCLPGRPALDGVGLFANSNPIAEGEKILSEAPMLEMAAADHAPTLTTLTDKLFHDIRKLNNNDRKTVLIMVQKEDNAYKDMTADEFANQLLNPAPKISHAVLDMFFSSSYPFSSKENGSTCRLFKNVRLLNHSCDPNAQFWWDNDKQIMTIRATRKIAAGEEILISYIDQFKFRHKRHADLGFQCLCPRCYLTGAALDNFESNSERLGAGFRLLDAFRGQYPPTTNDPMEVANDALVAAMNHDDRASDVECAAIDIINTMQELRLSDSRVAEA